MPTGLPLRCRRMHFRPHCPIFERQSEICCAVLLSDAEPNEFNRPEINRQNTIPEKAVKQLGMLPDLTQFPEVLATPAIV